MVKIEKDYVFEGPDGQLRLVDMFENRQQLYIHHSCGTTPRQSYPAARPRRTWVHRAGPRAATREDMTFACVSRAPYSSVARSRDKHGWTPHGLVARRRFT